MSCVELYYVCAWSKPSIKNPKPSFRIQKAFDTVLLFLQHDDLNVDVHVDLDF